MREAARARGAARVPEAFVVWLWEHRHVAPTLVTTDGVPIQVIYPGRHGGSWGPDFRGALLAIAGEISRGDVEVHVSARDWLRHGHQRDPAYQGTVLHVVLEAEAGLACPRVDGSVVPTVALADALAAPRALLWRRWQSAPGCAPPLQPCRSAEEATALLDQAGMERFAERVDRYDADLDIVDARQALWAGLCDALGYMANRGPFRALADRVPAREAADIARLSGPDVSVAVLFGEAGLLPSQRGRLPLGIYTQAIEAHWSATGRRGPAQPLGWRWIGVRPANQPVRRVAAAAGIGGAAAPPLDERVLATLAREPISRAPRVLAGILRSPADGYWREHQDFAMPLSRPVALVGIARAREITVNVLLPWAAALARRRRDPVLLAAATTVYRCHPRLAVNAVSRHMERQLLGPEARAAVTTACRQQGLHHLFARWCDARDCAACVAGGGFASNPDIASADAAGGKTLETLW